MHFDMEYLGAAEKNILMVRDATGGVDLDNNGAGAGSTVDITWDTEDAKGSDFTFTAPDSEITVEKTGLYRISYGVYVLMEYMLLMLLLLMVDLNGIRVFK